jgi:hypothetical protein
LGIPPTPLKHGNALSVLSDVGQTKVA